MYASCGASGPLFIKGLRKEPFRKNPPSLVNLQGYLGMGDGRRKGGWPLRIKPNGLDRDSHIVNSAQHPKTMHKLYIYCCLLRKHLARNYIHNAAKFLKTFHSPTFLSLSPTSSFFPSPTPHSKAQTLLPQFRVSPAHFSLLFQAAYTHPQQHLCAFPLCTHPGRPASSLVLSTSPEAVMQAQEQMPFQGEKETATIPNHKLFPR